MFTVELRMSRADGQRYPIPHFCVIDSDRRTVFVGDARDRVSADQKCDEFNEYPARATGKRKKKFARVGR